MKDVLSSLTASVVDGLLYLPQCGCSRCQQAIHYGFIPHCLGEVNQCAIYVSPLVLSIQRPFDEKQNRVSLSPLPLRGRYLTRPGPRCDNETFFFTFLYQKEPKWCIKIRQGKVKFYLLLFFFFVFDKRKVYLFLLTRNNRSYLWKILSG